MDRVYVICSGPSLKGFDFNQLKGQDIICINANIRDVPKESVVAYAFVDPFHLDDQREYLEDAPFPIYTVEPYSTIPERHNDLSIIKLKNTGISGIDWGEGIRHGFNGGYTAIGVALKLGYTDIRVLGMDLSKKGHYYDPDFKFDFHYVLAHLEKLKEDLKPGIQLTFYGKTNVRIFDNDELSNVLKPLKMTKKTKKGGAKYVAAPGFVIVRVLKDYHGQKRPIKKGEILEIPERKFRGRMMAKGYYELYEKGDKKPTQDR